MRHTHAMVRVRIYLDETDKYKGHPRYSYLMQFLRKEGYLGATVIRGIEGFGRHGKMHNANLLELSTDLPVIVEVVDNKANIDRLMTDLEALGMADGALITTEPVDVLQLGEHR